MIGEPQLARQCEALVFVDIRGEVLLTPYRCRASALKGSTKCSPHGGLPESAKCEAIVNPSPRTRAMGVEFPRCAAEAHIKRDDGHIVCRRHERADVRAWAEELPNPVTNGPSDEVIRLRRHVERLTIRVAELESEIANGHRRKSLRR